MHACDPAGSRSRHASLVLISATNDSSVHESTQQATRDAAGHCEHRQWTDIMRASGVIICCHTAGRTRDAAGPRDGRRGLPAAARRTARVQHVHSTRPMCSCRMRPTREARVTKSSSSCLRSSSCERFAVRAHSICSQQVCTASCSQHHVHSLRTLGRESGSRFDGRRPLQALTTTAWPPARNHMVTSIWHV